MPTFRSKSPDSLIILATLAALTMAVASPLTGLASEGGSSSAGRPMPVPAPQTPGGQNHPKPPKPNIILVKEKKSGFFTPAWLAFTSRCEILLTHQIVVTHTVGGITTIQTLPLDWQGDLSALIVAAKEGPLTTTPDLPDAESTRYEAYLESGSVALQLEGPENLENGSHAAKTLIKFLDLNCPKI